MAAELKRAVAQAKRSLDEGLRAVKETLTDLEVKRQEKAT